MNHCELGFGLMRLPLLDQNDRTSVDFDKTGSLIGLYLSLGGRYFDTAYKYCGGQSENAVRICLTSQYPRDRFLLADKMTLDALSSSSEQEPFFRKQLQKCNVEYFDRYLIHSLGPLRWQKAQAWDCFSFLARIKQEGRAKQIGFSYHGDAKTLDLILSAHPEIDFVQLQLNYLDWNHPVIQSKACWQTAVRHGKKISVMEPLKGGALLSFGQGCKAGFSPSDLGLRFIAEKENVEIVLSGMNGEKQVAENMRTMKEPLPLCEEERKELEKILVRYEQQRVIPCSGCDYCADQCSAKIPISRTLEIYNSYLMTGKASSNLVNSRIYLKNLCASVGRPSGCLSCGRCERICPQQIPIRKHLRQIADEMESGIVWPS